MSLHILAIDTTSDHGSIAVSEDQRVLEEVPLASTDGYAHVLFDAIRDLLHRHNLRLNQVDGFASAAGPGAFTGVRVGLTAAKGLAEANNRRVVAVSNLDALASFGTRPLRGVVMDARRGQVFGAVYDAAGHPIQEEVVTELDPWLSSLPQGDLEIVTTLELPPNVEFPIIRPPQALASAVAKIAARRFAAGLGQDPAEIDANYVRRSDAELLWRDTT
ncbi:MAG TPA: tRNA (adenosine(37)-N6)-threonylcarbamoyltransferase complex dimerization subunit type 1 TsaB [Bryobacteraceae bacterium]